MSRTTGRRLLAMLEALGVWSPARCVVIAVLLVLPSIGSRFVFDDNTLALALRDECHVVGVGHGIADAFVFVSGDEATNRSMIREGVVLPWWSYEKLQLSFYRPIAAFTHLLDAKLWPDSAVLAHVQSIAWYAGLVGIVAVFYRRFCSPAWLAGLSALLYAIDDAHAQTVSWVANRSAILASIFGVVTLIFHDRWRRGGHRASAALAVGALALGLLSAEFAVGACAYLFAYALFLDPGSRASRVGSVAPYAVLVALWRVVHRALGYGARGSDAYLDPAGDVFAFVFALPKRMLMLLLGQLAAPGADTAFWKPPSEHWILVVLGLVTVALVAWIAAPSLRNDPTTRFFGLGAVLATVPVSGSFSSDRLLLIVGLGAFPVLAKVFGDFVHALDRGDTMPRARSVVVAGYAVVHLPFAAALSPIRARSVEVAGSAVERADAGIPRDASIAGQTVIVANAPVDAFVSFVHVMRERAGVPRPRDVHTLTSATSPVEITRVSDRVLRVRPERGFLYTETERFWRAARDPLRLGERIELPTITVEISELTADGRPAAADFHFHEAFDSGTYVLRRFDHGRFVPWEPPTAGAAQRFPREDFVEILGREMFR